MKKLLALTIASCLFGSVVLVGIASAHVTETDTNLSIKRSPGGQVSPGEEVIVFGKLKPPKCRLGQKVKVFEVQPGDDALLGSDNLDADGEYGIAITPTSDMKVYAKVKKAFIVNDYEHTHKCKKDKSPTIKINVA
jgi:hypothetical protein